jgi:hypothetical protein
MTTLPPILSFAKLYSDHVNNPLGVDQDEMVEALNVLYTEWRTTDGAPKVGDLEADVIADFYSSIGAVGMFVAGGE